MASEPLRALEALKNGIKEGLENGYITAVQLAETGNDLLSCVTEYLFTVSIAQRLLKWRIDAGRNQYAIRLEYDATNFKNNGFRQRQLRPFMSRKQHFATRSGRIDIAILRHSKMLALRSRVAIEVKGVNPNHQLVVSDLVRLADALLAKDPIGMNSIRRGYSVFVERLDTPTELFDVTTLAKVCANRQEELRVEIVKQLGNYQASLVPDVYVWPIVASGASEVAAAMPEDWVEAKDIAEKSGAAIGVLITLSRGKVT